MRLIRRGTFETNSSSTHALVIPHKVDKERYDLYESLDSNYGFGRDESRLVDDWDEKLAYVYYTIHSLIGYKWSDNQYEITKEMVEDFKKKVNKLYKEVGKIAKYKSNNLKPDDIFNCIEGKKDIERNVICLDTFYGEPYVDHVGEFADEDKFFDKVFNDDEFLKRFLFNKDSYITIGGDEYRGYNIKTIGFQYDYEEHYINHGTEQNPQYEDVGEFWDKLKEYEKENDVFLKGN